MSTCRFCDDWRNQNLVHYSTRHYAHYRCYLEAGKSLADLSGWQIAHFPALLLIEFGLVDRKTLKFNDPAVQAKYDREQRA